MWPFDKEVPGSAHAAFDHATVYQQIHSGPGPSGLSSAGGTWRDQIAQHFANADVVTTKALKTAGVIWQGAAAQAFQAGVSPMSQWVGQAQQATLSAASALEDQAGHFAKVKTMPPPVKVTATDNALSRGWAHMWGQQTDAEKQEAAAQNASDHAAAMYATYTNNSTTTTSSVGFLYSEPPAQVTLAPPVTPQADPSANPHGSSVRVHGGSGGGGTTTPPRTPIAPVPPGGGPTRIQSAPVPTPPPIATPIPSPPPADRTRGGAPPVGAPPIGVPIGVMPIGGGGIGGEPGYGGGSRSRNIAARLAGEESGDVANKTIGKGGASAIGGLTEEEQLAAERGAAAGAAAEPGMAGGPMGARGGKKEEDAEHHDKFALKSDEYFAAYDLPAVAPRTIGERERP